MAKCTKSSEVRQTIVRGKVRSNLENVLRGALESMREFVPVAAALFPEQELLPAHHEELRKHNEGPHLSLAVVEAYLRAKQRLGPVDKHVNPKVVYALLSGACLHRVFLSHFLGQSFGPSDEMFVKDVVGAAYAGMRQRFD